MCHNISLYANINTDNKLPALSISVFLAFVIARLKSIVLLRDITPELFRLNMYDCVYTRLKVIEFIWNLERETRHIMNQMEASFRNVPAAYLIQYLTVKFKTIDAINAWHFYPQDQIKRLKSQWKGRPYYVCEVMFVPAVTKDDL